MPPDGYGIIRVVIHDAVHYRLVPAHHIPQVRCPAIVKHTPVDGPVVGMQSRVQSHFQIVELNVAQIKMICADIFGIAGSKDKLSSGISVDLKTNDIDMMYILSVPQIQGIPAATVDLCTPFVFGNDIHIMDHGHIQIDPVFPVEGEDGCPRCGFLQGCRKSGRAVLG